MTNKQHGVLTSGLQCAPLRVLSVNTNTSNRNFKNITAKEREELIKLWNKDKDLGKNSLNLELNRSQTEQLIKRNKGKGNAFSQSARPAKPNKSRMAQGTINGNCVSNNNRRLSLPNEQELAAARALTQLPLTPLKNSLKSSSGECTAFDEDGFRMPVTTIACTPVTGAPLTVAAGGHGSMVTSPRVSLSPIVAASPHLGQQQQQLQTQEVVMGKLRSGKQYSPSRNASPIPSPVGQKNVKDRNEKRRQPSSSPSEPVPKRQYTQGSPLQLSDLSREKMGQASSSPVSPIVIHQNSPNEFIGTMEKLMQNTLDKIEKQNAAITSRLTDAIKKNEGDIVRLQTGVTENLKAFKDHKRENAVKLAEIDGKILGAERELRDAKCTTSNLSNKLTVVDTIVSDHSATLDQHAQKLEDATSDLSSRLTTLESENTQLKRKVQELVAGSTADMDVDAETDDFPLENTLVMLRMIVQKDGTAEGAVKMILHDVLELRVDVLRAQVMRTYPNGKCTIKVELQSKDEVIEVLKSKHLLGRASHKVVRGVWIRKSKTRQQRIQDHNNSVILKALNLQGKIRQDAAGRLLHRSEGNKNSTTIHNPSGLDRESDIEHGNSGERPRNPIRGRGRRPRGSRGGGSSRQPTVQRNVKNSNAQHQTSHDPRDHWAGQFSNDQERRMLQVSEAIAKAFTIPVPFKQGDTNTENTESDLKQVDGAADLYSDEEAENRE